MDNSKKLYFFPLHSKNRQSKSSKQNEHINQVSLNWNGKSFEPLKLPDILIKPLFEINLSKLIFSLKGSFNSTHFYWKNQIICGDSLLAMHALLQDGYQNSVQMIYVDPPYGINYKPQNNRNQTAGKGYIDSWKHGLASYLDHLRDRFILMRELLNSTGSIFVQIGQTNMHYVRCILDEIFGASNCVNVITFRTAISTNKVTNIADHLLWYAKDKKKVFQRKLFTERPKEKSQKTFTYIEKEENKLYSKKLAFKPQEVVLRLKNSSQKRNPRLFPVYLDGKEYYPPSGFEWRWDEVAFDRLIQANRLVDINGKLYGKRYESDFPFMILTNVWMDTSTSTFAARKHYAVHTNPKVIWRCMAMTTKPGDLVLDPTLGSGTTAVVAERYERRWIGIDTNFASISSTMMWLLEKPFQSLQKDKESQSVLYQTFIKTSLSSIAKGKKESTEFLFDKPLTSKKKDRPPSPFKILTLEAPDGIVNYLENNNIVDNFLPIFDSIIKQLTLNSKNNDSFEVKRLSEFFTLTTANKTLLSPKLPHFEYFELCLTNSKILVICAPFLRPIPELELISHLEDLNSQSKWDSLILVISLGQLSWGAYQQLYLKYGPTSKQSNRLRIGYYHNGLSVSQINIQENSDVAYLSSWIDFASLSSNSLMKGSNYVFWALLPVELSDRYFSHNLKVPFFIKISKNYSSLFSLSKNKEKFVGIFSSSFSELNAWISQNSPSFSDSPSHFCVLDKRGIINYGILLSLKHSSNVQINK
ncbi:MAG: site-specific DNA-methyltransferase [Candidatus Lokiarchaeota archaeon]|nr:site-specific DNA-methyltransferase [Candidatus Harpocratesius repetitus]